MHSDAVTAVLDYVDYEQCAISSRQRDIRIVHSVSPHGKQYGALGAHSKTVFHAFVRPMVTCAASDAMVACEQHHQEYAVLLTSFVPPRVSAGVLHRVADRFDVLRPYQVDNASAAVVAAPAAHIDYDFAENGSIFRQTDYWAQARVRCRHLGCPCRSFSSGSVIGPVFSENSGENGVEEAL